MCSFDYDPFSMMKCSYLVQICGNKKRVCGKNTFICFFSEAGQSICVERCIGLDILKRKGKERFFFQLSWHFFFVFPQFETLTVFSARNLECIPKNLPPLKYNRGTESTETYRYCIITEKMFACLIQFCLSSCL